MDGQTDRQSDFIRMLSVCLTDTESDYIGCCGLIIVVSQITAAKGVGDVKSGLGITRGRSPAPTLSPA